MRNGSVPHARILLEFAPNSDLRWTHEAYSSPRTQNALPVTEN